MSRPKQSMPLENRLAWALALAALAQIVLGALVTTYKAGMAVPDWPTTFGHNLFLYPPSQWWPHWNIRLEHGHRLFGTLVGLLALIVAGVLWRVDSRRAVRTLAVTIVAGVCLQAGLGGLRVLGSEMNLATIFRLPAPAVLAATAAILAVALQLAMTRSDNWTKPVVLAKIALSAAICVGATLVCLRLEVDQLLMARVHAAIAPVVLAAAGALVLLTSPKWSKVERPAGDRRRIRLAVIIAWSLAATVLLQISLGSPMRHVHWATDPIWFWYWTWFHLITATMLACLILWLLFVCRRRRQTVEGVASNEKGAPDTHALASVATRLLSAVIGLQLVLGAFTWLVNYGCPPWFAQYLWEPDYTIQSAGWIESTVTTTHVVTGLGTLTLAACLALWLGRLLDRRESR